jgi:hypothetical protein
MATRFDIHSAPPRGLPAQRIDAAGDAHVDLSAVLALALPLIANSAVQVVLNLTECRRSPRSVRCNGWCWSSS